MSDRRTRRGPRATSRQWLADNWDPDLSLLEWRRKLVESGWATPTWPAEWYGRGLPGWADPIVARGVRRRRRRRHRRSVAAWALAAPTLLAHGSDELKRRLLPRAITGEDTWCQLFSEPTNGSDLAGLATHAERDGDEWVVNGQKLWSTSAHHADLGLLLARTDPDVPKHRGISYFVLPMHQPGVEVRPVHQMNEHSSFNEVFLSDARVPAANLVGLPGDGWRIAMTTLAFERQFATVGARRAPAPPDVPPRRPPPRPRSTSRPTPGTRSGPGAPTSSQQVAELQGRTDDPIARQQMAGLVALRRAHEWTARAGPGRPRRRPATGLRGLARQARRQPRRAGVGAHALAARRRRRPAAATATRCSTASSPRCCCPCRRSRSPAAPTRSSTTSSARRSSTCRASRPWTATSRTARSAADGDRPVADHRIGRPHSSCAPTSRATPATTCAGSRPARTWACRHGT